MLTLRPFKRQAPGFTLVELLIAIVIVAIILPILAISVFQVMVVSAADRNRMDTIKQLENALHWINRDAQMAWPSLIRPNSGTPILFTTVPAPFTDAGLHLRWTQYDAGGIYIHNVRYFYDSTTRFLRRREQINIQPLAVTSLAGHLDINASTYSFTYDSPTSLDNNVLTVNLTASIGGFKPVSEMRSLKVKPRNTQ
jgi:prepilin-type N-terminal cleavage/methylation domain-containing protein